MITFELGQVGRLARALSAAPQIVDEELTRFMHEVTEDLQAEVQERTPTTHGTLRASIIGDVRKLPGVGIEGVVGTSLAYAAAVEYGAKPHHVGRKGIEALTEWAKQKLGVRGKAAESAAWGVAKAIAKRGTEPVGMFRDAMADNRDQIAAHFDDALRRIEARLGEQP